MERGECTISEMELYRAFTPGVPPDQTALALFKFKGGPVTGIVHLALDLNYDYQCEYVIEKNYTIVRWRKRH